MKTARRRLFIIQEESPRYKLHRGTPESLLSQVSEQPESKTENRDPENAYQLSTPTFARPFFSQGPDHSTEDSVEGKRVQTMPAALHSG